MRIYALSSFAYSVNVFCCPPDIQKLIFLSLFFRFIHQFDFAINALMSMNMVVTLLIAFVLDNTVPGTRQERGVYIWSHPEDLASDPSLLADYSLPRKVSRFFCWSRCCRT